MTDPGRNDLCPCGSGRKYKRCCGIKDAQPPLSRPVAKQQEAIAGGGASDFEQALRCHNAGRLEEARQICQQILQAQANHADALRLLALICQQTGQHAAATELLQRLVSVMPTGTAHYNLGNAFAMQGMMDSAIIQYERSLSFAPDHVEAHNNLGNALAAQGRLEQAIASYQRALSYRPDHAGAHTNLGNALMDSGRIAEAIVHYQRAASLQSDSADIHYSLCSALASQGNAEQAIACYQHVLALRPDHAEAHHNLGIALASLGKIVPAIASYGHGALIHSRKREAFALLQSNRFSEARTLYAELCAQDKMDAEAWFFLGAINGQLKNTAEAVECFHRVVALSPNHALAHYNLGMALRTQGRLEDAVQALREAARLAPQREEVHLGLANTYVDMERPEGAEACYRELLKIKPNDANTHYNLGMMLHRQGRLEEAIGQYQESLRIDPDSARVCANLGGAYFDQGKLEESLRCHWRALELAPEDDELYSNTLMTLLYSPDVEPARIFAEHRKWGERHALPTRRDYPNDRSVERRLRVGYVSPNFGNHAAARFFEPLLANHNADVVETIFYSNTLKPDTATARLRGFAGRWRDIRKMKDDEVARLVREDEVDILVDLAGHTSDHSLKVFAHKPAPIQISYIGYPATTGLAAVDYQLTDEVVDPPGSEVYYTEKLYYLPDGFCCYQPPPGIPDATPLPARVRGFITFASFSALSKINDRVLDVWSRVLHANPSARLLIYRDAVTAEARDRYHWAFEARDIDRRRVDVGAALPAVNQHLPSEARYMGLFGQVDLILDTFPWNNHAMACETLWGGIPLVTLAGDRHAARMCASVLTMIGLPNLVAQTPDEYVAIATGLATNLNALEDLRTTLRSRMQNSPLCDGKSFAAKVENVYRGMWKAWCDSH